MWKTQTQSDDTMGGFMKSPMLSQSSSSQQAVKTWQRGKKNIFPVLVSDLKPSNFKNDSFYILGQKALMVQVVAIIRSLERQSNCNVYEIDDYTGPWVRVYQWLYDMDEPDYVDPTMAVNAYVRINGTMRNMGGETHLVTFSIRPVTDYNDITRHMLSVICAKKSLMNSNSNSSMVTDSVAPSTSTASTSYDDSSLRKHGLSSVQQKLFQIVQNHSHGEGDCSIKTMMDEMRGVSMAELRKILAFLHNEGHIYSTSDEDHFKATDC